MKRISVLALALLATSQALYAVPANLNQNPPPIVAKSLKTMKIDLNKADVATLSHAFKGIGKKRAETIVQYRKSHQGFKTLEELANVKGFGKKFISKNIEQLKAVFFVS